MRFIRSMIVGTLMITLYGHGLFGQQMTLEDCITEAIHRSLDVKNAALLQQSAEREVHRAKFAAYPNLNLNYNIGINNGRSIDPFTNSYINTGLTFSNLGLSSGLTLFNGFRIKNRKKQARFDQLASQEEVEQTKEMLTLEVMK